MHSIIPIYQVYLLAELNYKRFMYKKLCILLIFSKFYFIGTHRQFANKGFNSSFGPTAFYFNTILITGIPFITITHIFHRTINITLY